MFTSLQMTALVTCTNQLSDITLCNLRGLKVISIKIWRHRQLAGSDTASCLSTVQLWLDWHFGNSVSFSSLCLLFTEQKSRGCSCPLALWNCSLRESPVWLAIYFMNKRKMIEWWIEMQLLNRCQEEKFRQYTFSKFWLKPPTKNT